MLIGSIASQTNVTCNGFSDGEVTITATGGSTPYLFDIGSGNQSSGTFSGLIAGTYTVVISDSNSCIDSVSVTISQPNELILTITDSTDAKCNGVCDGSVTGLVTGGTLPYQWSWPPGHGTLFTDSTGKSDSLCAGIYVLTITDSNSCVDSFSVLINEPNLLVGSLDSSTNISCKSGNDGEIFISASGGTPAYLYNIGSGNQASGTFSGLTAGSYIITITDDNGCQDTVHVTLSEPDTIISNGIITNVSCNNITDGTITLTLTGGATPYNFVWTSSNPGFTDPGTENLSGLDSGSYTISLTDSNGCSYDTTLIITKPNEIFANGISTNVICHNDSNGTITLNTNNGVGTYLWLWSGPNSFTATTENLTNLDTGTYAVTITDGNNCTKDTSFTITQPDSIAITGSHIDITCFGANDGSVSISVIGGSNPLSWAWTSTNAGFVDPGGNATSLINLGPGDYTISVIDNNLCIKDSTFTILEAAEISGTFNISDESCFGTCDGAITSNITVGVAPLTFAWTSTDPGFVNNSLANQFNLCSGDYYLSIVDGDNCNLLDTLTVTSADQLIITETITNITCFGDSSGAISIIVTGGNITTSLDYTYSWIGINTGFTSSSANISNLVADSYTITITDDDGCSTIQTYIVSENNALTLITSSIDVACGTSNGQVQVNASGGVIALDYTYSWTDATTSIIGTTSIVPNLPAGTYTVLVTDDLGCQDSATAVINDISASTIVVDTIIHETCVGDNDGSISVTITVSPPPGALSWIGPAGFTDPGGNNTTISNLSAGQYTATLIDGAGCQKIEVIDVIAAQTLSINSVITEPLCNNDNNGEILIFPSGGQVLSTYQYDWDIDGTGDLDDDQNQDSLLAGTYVVTVYDDNACSATETYILNNPNLLTGTVNSSFAACGSNDGYVTVSPSGGTIGVTGYSFSWIDQSTGSLVGITDSIGNLPAGCYEITVTDDNSCQYVDVTCINNPTGPIITLDAIDSVSCYGLADGNIFISVSGGIGAYTYDWQTTNLSNCCNEDLTLVGSGTYSITVTDSLGCSSSEVYNIEQPNDFAVSGLITNVACNNNSTGEINLTITGGTPNYNFSWAGPNSFTSSLEDLINLDTGTYIISGTDDNGCIIPSTSFTITQPDTLIISLSSTNTACSSNSGTATVSASGGSIITNYIYSWTNTSGTIVGTDSSITNLSSGMYYVSVNDDNNCTNTDSIIVNQSSAPTITLDTINDVVCNGNQDGSIFISVSSTASPFTYNWSGTVTPDIAHQTNEDLLTWFAGTYTVVVTDSAGCSDSLSNLIIAQPSQLTSSINSTDIGCFGDTTGSINLTTIGGTLPLQYSWTNSSGIVISTIEDPLNLGSGTYTIVITDSVGCSVIDSATINEPSDLTLVGSSVSSTCGNSDGSVNVLITGGTVASNYTISWYDIASGYPGTLINSGNSSVGSLSAGAYQVVVSDDNGCSDSLVIPISDISGPALSYVATNILCFGNNNGAINLTVLGSNPFIFNWVGPPPFTNPGTEDLSGLNQGTYTVIVTDNNGCISTESILVNGPSGSIQVNSTITDLTCFDDGTGSINIDIVGGTPPYQTLWTGINSFSSILEDISALDSGQYVLDIIDANNCLLSGNIFNISQPDSIIIDTTILQPTCGLTDGQIDVIVTGGTVSSSYSYIWNDITTPSYNIGFTSTLTNIGAGNYQIIVSDDNSCTDSMVVAISDLTGPILSATTTDVDCVGDNDGTINLTIIGSGPFVIDWDNDGIGDNDDNEDLINLTAGTYNVVVQDLSSGCIASLSVNINVSSSISLSFTTIEPSCFGDSTASINSTVSGGTPGFTYSWTLSGFPVSSVEDPSNLTAGNYILTITDTNGCQHVDSTLINEPTDLSLTGSTISSTCGNPNGQASVSVMGGTGAYTYSWFDISSGYPGTAIGSGNSTETGLMSGVYNVIVLDANNCTDSIPISVSDANGPIITFTTVDVDCFGNATGEINLTITGTTPFTFAWSGPPSFTNPGTEDLTNLIAGTYSVVVNDGNGCSSTVAIDILEPSSALSINSLVTDLICYGDSSGSINILITGGTTPYTTTWTGPNSFTSTNEDISTLDTGQYIINIIDSNGCTTNSSFNITQPDSILITPTITYPTCNASDGQISVSVTGGTIFTDYTYTWDDLSTPAYGISSFSSITNIGAGNYQITVDDDNGCSNSDIYSITNVNAPVLSAITTDVDCFSNATGSINLTITGTSSFTIDWDNDGVGDNDDNEDLFNLTTGTYNVLVNDLSTGCIAALSVNINEPPLLIITGVATDLFCFNDSTGSIDISITGGFTPCLYDWDNDGVGDNDDTQDLDSLLIGTYNIIVIDSNACSQTASYIVAQPQDISIVTNIISHVDCNGNGNGSIDAVISGGTGTLTPLWSILTPGGGLVPNSEDQTTLDGGTYQLIVTDSNSCVNSTLVTINEPDTIITNGVITNVSCYDQIDGAINLTTIGGSIPFTFVWTSSDPSFVDPGTEDLSGLDSGSYTVSITDFNGCTYDTTLIITKPSEIFADGTFTNLNCYNDSSGTITLNTSNGAGGYIWSWTGPNSFNSNNENLTNLDTGTYSVTITDISGCTKDTSLSITQPTEILISYTKIDNLCFGDSIGEINISAVGGLPTFTWQWSGPSSFISSDDSINNLISGTYTVTVTDNNSCFKDSSIDILSSSQIIMNVITNNANCAFSDGIATANVIGGTVTGAYIYDWDNDGVGDNDDLASIDSLAAGSYTLIVYDDNNCSNDTTVNINITSGPVITIDSTKNPLCNGGSDGAIYTSVTGGTAPYSYVWNSSITSQISYIENITAGTYYLQLLDSVGCVSYDTMIISEPTILTYTSITSDASCNICDGSVMVTANGGNPTTTYSYLWGSGNTSSAENSLCSGVYSVEISDSLGCTITGNITISDNSGPSGENIIANSPSCFGLSDGSASITGLGGATPYSYIWLHNGSTNQTETGLSAGTYFVEITDDNGCTRVAEVIITNPSEIDIIPFVYPSTCTTNDGSISLIVSGGSGGYSYSWLHGNINSTINNLSSGIYTVTVTDNSGCQSTELIPLSNFNNVTLTLSTTNTTCFGYSDGAISSSVIGAAGNITYTWLDDLGNSLGLNTSSISGLPEGTYVLEIIDASTGCSQFETATVISPDEFMISLPNISDASCSSVCDGSASVVVSGGSLPYSYSWSNGEVGIIADSLCVGVSTVTITDNAGCNAQETIIIDDNFTVSINENVLNSSCGSCDGAVTITPTGVNSPYTITWFDNSISNTHNNLCAGVYDYIITDNNGCLSQESVSVNNNGGPTNETIVTGDVSCYNGNDGTASVIPFGGTAPYTYLWVPTGQTSNSITGLTAGTHFLEVIDANGCIRVVPVIINEPDQLSIQSLIIDASCGNSNASVSLNIYGGISPYITNWLGSTTGSYITGLSSGTYTAIIEDANSCLDTFDFSVNNINGPDILITNTGTSCFGVCDGQASASVSNGSGNYTYQWSSGGSNSTELGLCSGSHFIDVTDVNTGCISSSFFTISQPDSISFSNPFVINPTCADSCNGEASVIPSGGTLSYTIVWPTGIGSYLTGLCSGVQTVIVTDASGCMSSQDVTIDQASPITVNIDNITDAYCVNNSDGAIAITTLGGDGNYSYSWTTSPSSSFTSNSEDISNLLPTNYIVYITDGNSCVGVDTIPIDTIHVLLADAGLDTAICLNDCILITGTGSGSSSYALSWLDSNGVLITTTDTTTICSSIIGDAEFILEISDQNCTSYDTISITTHPLPTADAGTDILLLYGSIVNLGGSPTGPSGASFLWLPLDQFMYLDDSIRSNPEIELLQQYTYTVIVTDTNNCVSTDDILVTPIPEITYPSGFSPNSDGVNDNWLIENIDEFPNCVVEIYNRWGEMLFRSVGYNDKWGGNFRNKPLPVGTYYYIIELNDSRFPNPYTGPVTIMR